MRLLEGRRVLLTGASGFIGTSLVALLVEAGAEVVNVDVVAPLDPAQARHWREGDVMDRDALIRLVGDVDPQFVVHLAARTDTLSDDPHDYEVNHRGTANAVAAADAAPGVERFVLISTQFVLGPGAAFESETGYAPHTAYGASKVEAERLLRSDPPRACWTILRPTNVWGPWHLRYQRQFWRVLGRGLYLHPSAPDPVRSYGYVGSVCLQILAALVADRDRVHGRALYVGDDPVPQSTWVDAFSVALRGRPARRVPVAVLRAIARAGDRAERLGVPSLLTSSRFRSMTMAYPTPMSRTWQALGCHPVIALGQGVDETVGWLREGRSAPVAGWLARAPLAATSAQHPAPRTPSPTPERT